MAAAGLVLVAATAVGCSDDDSGSTPAAGSVADFCTALERFQGSVEAADSTDLAAYVRTLKEAAAEVADAGVPEDMPNPARLGFELTVERIEELPDAATQEDVAALGDVSEADQRRLDALEDYIENVCPDVSS